MSNIYVEYQEKHHELHDLVKDVNLRFILIKGIKRSISHNELLILHKNCEYVSKLALSELDSYTEVTKTFLREFKEPFPTGSFLNNLLGYKRILFYSKEKIFNNTRNLIRKLNLKILQVTENSSKNEFAIYCESQLNKEIFEKFRKEIIKKYTKGIVYVAKQSKLEKPNEIEMLKTQILRNIEVGENVKERNEILTNYINMLIEKNNNLKFISENCYKIGRINYSKNQKLSIKKRMRELSRQFGGIFKGIIYWEVKDKYQIEGDFHSILFPFNVALSEIGESREFFNLPLEKIKSVSQDLFKIQNFQFNETQQIIDLIIKNDNKNNLIRNKYFPELSNIDLKKPVRKHKTREMLIQEEIAGFKLKLSELENKIEKFEKNSNYIKLQIANDDSDEEKFVKILTNFINSKNIVQKPTYKVECKILLSDLEKITGTKISIETMKNIMVSFGFPIVNNHFIGLKLSRLTYKSIYRLTWAINNANKRLEIVQQENEKNRLIQIEKEAKKQEKIDAKKHRDEQKIKNPKPRKQCNLKLKYQPRDPTLSKDEI